MHRGRVFFDYIVEIIEEPAIYAGVGGYDRRLGAVTPREVLRGDHGDALADNRLSGYRCLLSAGYEKNLRVVVGDIYFIIYPVDEPPELHSLHEGLAVDDNNESGRIFLFDEIHSPEEFFGY